MRRDERVVQVINYASDLEGLPERLHACSRRCYRQELAGYNGAALPGTKKISHDQYDKDSLKDRTLKIDMLG